LQPRSNSQPKISPAGNQNRGSNESLPNLAAYKS
jgi:hypothetical protein